MNRDCLAGEGDGALIPRRSFLGSLGLLGMGALGGPLLGQGLWLRGGGSLPSGLVFNPTTLTMSQGNTYTAGIPSKATITVSGVSRTSTLTGTYTQTQPPDPGGTGPAFTSRYAAPGGQSQPITVAWTDVYSYTPIWTNYQTVSWSGASYTATESNTVVAATLTLYETFSATYTWTTPAQQGEEEQLPPPWKFAAGAAPSIETVDAIGLDITDPAQRVGRPIRLMLGQGMHP